MTAKMWIEGLFMIAAALIFLFSCLLGLIDWYYQARQYSKVNGVVDLLGDFCFVGLNLGFWGVIVLIPAWLIAVFVDFFVG